MTLTADSLLSSIQIILQDLKQDIFSRFGYNLDENISFLDLTRNLILLENVFSDDSIRNSQEIKRLAFQLSQRNTEDAFHRNHKRKEDQQNYEWSLNNNPFNIQHNEEDVRDEIESDTSNDSIPVFHKEILREYKPSKEELKKQNRVIRSIMQENKDKNNHNTQDLSQKQHGSSRNTHKTREHSNNKNNNNNKDSQKNHRSLDSSSDEGLSRRQKEKNEMRVNTKTTKRIKQFDEDRRNNLSRPDRNEIKKIILENQPECVDTTRLKGCKLSHDKSTKTVKSASSGKKNYEKAGRALEDLLKQREKEFQRICKIEQRIKEYKEQEETAGRRFRQQSEGEIVDRKIASRQQQQEMEYIHEINGQITNLDKEIKQITTYIQECILKEH